MKKVLAGGCFNSIHPGHVHFLKEAKSLGDFLIVVLANDVNNRKPYAIPQEKRKEALEKLGIADTVLVGSSVDFSEVVLKEKPSIIALGYDQELLGKTKEATEKLGIIVVRISKLGNYGTRLGH